MKLTIYKYPEREEDFIGTIDIKERYTEKWYQEQMRRFGEMSKHKTVEECYDVDESYELGQISLRHLESMIKFLKDETN